MKDEEGEGKMKSKNFQRKDRIQKIQKSKNSHISTIAKWSVKTKNHLTKQGKI